jgi:superfamily II DNA or RNA helicase
MATPTPEQIKIAVDLLVDRYGISSQLLGKLYGENNFDEAKKLYRSVSKETCNAKKQAELLISKKGATLFAGSDEAVKQLRRKILESADEETIRTLYQKHEPNGTKQHVSYMIGDLVNKPWFSGKRWAMDFVRTFHFPDVFTGIQNSSKHLPKFFDIPAKRRLPELVPFQITLKNEMKKILELKGKETRCVVTLPTGGGKTRVAVEAFIEWMQPRFNQQKYLLWIAQSQELCEQAVQCIAAVWSENYFVEDLRVYRYFQGYKLDMEQMIGGVVVTSIQQLYSRLKLKDPVLIEILQNLGAMIIDEAHHAVTKMYKDLIETANHLCGKGTFPICGLTATPGRSGDGTRNLVDFFKAQLITPLLGPEYDSNPVKYFRENGYLSKAKHIVVKSGIPYELTDEELKEFENESTQHVFLEHKFLKKLADDRKRNELILKQLMDIPEGNRVLVYACTVEHAEILASMLNTLGRRSASISAKTSSSVRRVLIEEFRNGSIEFLFNYGVLTTGFDAPKTNYIVICRPTTSVILYEQIVGRGMRGPKFNGTPDCTVIDFSDNILRMGVQMAYSRFSNDWPDYWEEEQTEGNDWEVGMMEVAAASANGGSSFRSRKKRRKK